MNEFIELTLDNAYNLSENDRYKAIIYNNSPIGFIDCITAAKIHIKIWTKYMNVVPEYGIMDSYLRQLGNDKSISNLRLELDSDELRLLNEYKERVLKCWIQLLPHMDFSDAKPEHIINLIYDVMNGDYETIMEHTGIKLEV